MKKLIVLFSILIGSTVYAVGGGGGDGSVNGSRIRSQEIKIIKNVLHNNSDGNNSCEGGGAGDGAVGGQ